MVAAAITPARTRGRAAEQRQRLAALAKLVTVMRRSKSSTLEERAIAEDSDLGTYNNLKAFLDQTVKSLRTAVEVGRSRANPPAISESIDKVLSPGHLTQELGWWLRPKLIQTIRAWLLELDDEERLFTRVNTSDFARTLVARLSRTTAKAVRDGNTAAAGRKAIAPKALRIAYEVLLRFPREVR